MKKLATLAVACVLIPLSAAAATQGTWTDAELARASDVIVTGRVRQIASGWDADTIYTYVTLAIDDVVKGWVPEREVTIKQLGGRVGELALAIDQQAAFEIGEEVVAFLSARPRDRTLTTTALWQGKWSLVRLPSGAAMATRKAPGGGRRLGGAEARTLTALIEASRAPIDAGTRRDLVVRPPDARSATPVASLDATQVFQARREISPQPLAAPSCFIQFRSAGVWAISHDGCGEPDGGAGGISGRWLHVGTSIDAVKAGVIGAPAATASSLMAASAIQAPAGTAAAAAAQTSRVSVTSSGDQLGGDSRFPAISPDGRYVAFTFNASILGLHDNQTGQTTAIGSTTGGSRFTADSATLLYLSSTTGAQTAYDVAAGTTRTFAADVTGVSDDLRFALVTSADTSGVAVRDLTTGQQTAVPPPPPWPDAPGTRRSVRSALLSPTGRYVAFYDFNLPPTFLGRRPIGFIWDRAAAAPVQIGEGFPLAFTRDEGSLLLLVNQFVGAALYDIAGLTLSSLPGPTLTGSLAMSQNGRFVGFIDNGAAVGHVSLLDRSTGAMPLIDLAPNGAAANASATEVSVDDSGRVAYASFASNLVAADTNGTADVFLTTGGAAVSPPGAPVRLQSTVTPAAGGSLVTLTWSAPSTGGTPSNYVIEAGSAPGLKDQANFSTGSTATTYSTVVSGTGVFFVRVRAANAAGSGEASNEVTVSVGQTVASPPEPPSNLTVSASGSTVSLAWQAPVRGTAPTGYVIKAGSSSFTSDLANFATNSTATSYTATGVSQGTYFIRVSAYNSAGQGGSSNQVTLTVGGSQPCTAAPAAPSFVASQVTGSTVTLTWEAVAGLPASYVVEAGSASGLSDLANFDTGSAATTLTVGGVGSGRYYVRVRGNNACGVGAPSPERLLVVP